MQKITPKLTKGESDENMSFINRCDFYSFFEHEHILGANNSNSDI